jgi:hypothetical protein
LAHFARRLGLALAIAAATRTASAADVRSGVLDELSPTWDRIESDAPASSTCGLPSQDSPHDGVSYNVFPIRVAEPENLVVEVAPSGTTVEDTVIALYCGTFDPADPGAHLVAWDDDGGDAHLSGFSADDTVALSPGSVYWLVVTTFAPGDEGVLEVRLESPTATFDTTQERSGELTAASPRWDPIDALDPSVDLTCHRAVETGAATDAAYEAFEIRASAPALLQAEVVGTDDTTLTDTILALYCDPFDPLDPTAGLVAVDDDDGPLQLSRFRAGDGIALAPETTYWLVLSTYQADSYGRYELRIHDPRIAFVPEPRAEAAASCALLALRLVALALRRAA